MIKKCEAGRLSRFFSLIEKNLNQNECCYFIHFSLGPLPQLALSLQSAQTKLIKINKGSVKQNRTDKQNP